MHWALDWSSDAEAEEPSSQIGVQCLFSLFAERNQPLLFPLPVDFDQPPDQGEVFHIHLHEFADTEPTSIQELQHGSVSDTSIRLGVRQLQDRFYLSNGQKARLSVRQTWTSNKLGWIGRNLTLSIEIAKEGTDSRQFSSHGTFGVSSLVQMNKKISNADVIYLQRIDPFVLSSLSEIGTEFSEVSPIIFHGMRRVVLLKLEIMDEGVDSCVHDARFIITLTPDQCRLTNVECRLTGGTTDQCRLTNVECRVTGGTTDQCRLSIVECRVSSDKKYLS